MDSPVKKFFAKLFSYFMQGLLYILPLALTIYTIYFSITFIDNMLHFRFPGLGILIAVVGITFIGFIGSRLVAKPIARYVERIIDRMPLIKVIYNSIKDLLSAFVGKEKKFDKPVLFRISKDSELERLGFITETDLSRVGITEAKSAVYAPHSYNFSGNLYIVPNENIRPLDTNAAEMMKFIVSGGVIRMNE